jgi:NAD(P)-dependent dehydrogenase (short-subunit alcohol dehydrogenase family)
MNTVVFGATQGMGRALARVLAGRGDRLFLLGRNAAELEKSRADLEARRPGSVAGVAHCDLLEPRGFAGALEQAEESLGRIDTVVVSAGLFATQEVLENEPERAAQVLLANFTNTVLFCEEARKRLLAAGGGRLVAFSSVAGDRARKPVVLYGAAKAGLSAYLEGLDHRYRAQGLITVCVKPGFVRTGMTEGLKPPPFAGDPDAVARQVARAIDRGTPLIYAPPIWRYVLLVIRHLPRFVMRRIGF